MSSCCPSGPPETEICPECGEDRKSTRLNSSHVANLVCRLLLEKKKIGRRPSLRHVREVVNGRHLLVLHPSGLHRRVPLRRHRPPYAFSGGDDFTRRVRARRLV